MNTKQQFPALLCVALFGLIVSYQSWPDPVPVYGSDVRAASYLSVNLPQWDGRDYAIVPRGIEIAGPAVWLPEGWIPPRTYPLPRDMNRDFPEKRYPYKKYGYVSGRGSLYWYPIGPHSPR